MQYRNEALGVRVTRAEAERFAAPLLLIHGLWSGSWVWERMAGFLGHRGWESWALDLPGRPGAPTAEQGDVPADLLAHIETVARAMPGPPVLVAHDAGAVLALQSAAAVEARALVLINPTLRGQDARRCALGGLGRTVRAILGARLDPPTGMIAATYHGRVTNAVRQTLDGNLVPESGRLVYDLLRGQLDEKLPASLPPALLIGGARDPVHGPAVLTESARRLGAAQVVVEGTHWLPIEERWRETATCAHRFIVRSLGGPLLLLRDEEADDGLDDDVGGAG